GRPSCGRCCSLCRTPQCSLHAVEHGVAVPVRICSSSVSVHRQDHPGIRRSYMDDDADGSTTGFALIPVGKLRVLRPTLEKLSSLRVFRFNVLEGPPRRFIWNYTWG